MEKKKGIKLSRGSVKLGYCLADFLVERMGYKKQKDGSLLRPSEQGKGYVGGK